MAAMLQMAVTASDGRVSSTELVFIRAVVQGIVVVAAMTVYRDDETGQRLICQPLGRTRQMQTLVIARGMVGGAGFLLYYYSIRVLPLGDATTLLSLNPVLTVVLAPLLLPQEEANWQTSHFMAAVASVVGCLFMTQPTFLFPSHDDDTDNNTHPKFSMGHVTALLGACTGALVFILIRRAGQTGVHTLQLLFSWVLFGILFSLCISVGLPWLSPAEHTLHLIWPPRPAWPYIAGMAVVGTGAHFLLNYAARLAPAGLSSLMRTSGIVWAFFFEWLFFHATPDPLVACGVLLIVGSLAAIALEKYFQSLTVNNDTVHCVNDDSSTSSSGSDDATRSDIELLENTPLTIQGNDKDPFSCSTVPSSSLEVSQNKRGWLGLLWLSWGTGVHAFSAPVVQHGLRPGGRVDAIFRKTGRPSLQLFQVPVVPTGVGHNDYSYVVSNLMTSLETFDGSSVVDPVVISSTFWSALGTKLISLLIGQLLATIVFSVVVSIAASQLSGVLDRINKGVLEKIMGPPPPPRRPSSTTTNTIATRTITPDGYNNKNNRNIDLPKLAICLAIDVLGSASELVPLVGELSDVVYAPVAATALRALYGSNVVFLLEFGEEILPFTDIIPLATICWVVDTFAPSSGLAQLLQLGDYGEIDRTLDITESSRAINQEREK